MNHKFTKILCVLQSTIKEEPTEIRQDIDIMSSPSRDSAKTAHKGKRRSLFGRVGRVFRRLFLQGKKKKADSDPGEINEIPPETTNGEDIVPTSEKETEATRGTEHVYASEINIGPTSGTDSGHQQAAEELEFTTSESDQKSEILSTNVTDIVETVPNPAAGTESTTATESDTSSDGSFVSADHIFTRVLETVAELKDGKETSTFTETLSIPESGSEITVTTNNKSDSEDTTQSTDATDIEKIVPTSTFGTLVAIFKTVSELIDLEISSSTEFTSVGGWRKDSWSICLEKKTETTDSSDGIVTTAIPEGGCASSEGTNFNTIVGTVPASRDGSGSITTDESETNLASETKTSFASETETSLARETKTSLASETPQAAQTLSISQLKSLSSTGSSDSVYSSAEEPKFTPFIDDVDAPTGELEIRMPTETIPESGIEITATLDTIQPTKATDIVEAVPTSTDGMESTVIENVAELKDRMDISIPSETASIPESGTEIAATTDIVSASELKTEVISSTDNALDHTVLPRKENVPPLTTQEEPAEDKPHPSGGSVQHAQQNATPAGKCQSFFSKISAFLCIWKRNASSGGTNEIQSDVPVPLTVKSFKYHKLLGDGLFGKVFVASHPATDQLLAIKKAKKTPWPLEELLAERTAQEMVRGSRFFPELYATFQTKEFLFYVMEYVKGGTLSEFKVKRPHLDHDSIRFIAAELLCAIQALHSRGIVHCDLHAKNILIDSTGHVKIIDFGLSRIKEEPYNPDTTIITPYKAYKEPWFDYLSEYLCFRRILLYLQFAVTHTKVKDPELMNLIEECKSVRRNLRKHPFFTGIDWKELEAGNVTPPYVMEPDPKVNQSKEIKVKGKRFMKLRRLPPTIEVPGFDFVSDRWREMLQPQQGISMSLGSVQILVTPSGQLTKTSSTSPRPATNL